MAAQSDGILVIRVGLDLVSVADVERTLASPLARRYLQRVYTDREVADCRTSAGIDPARLSARFAAKEATLKAISIEHEAGVSLAEIEVHCEASGRVSLALAGSAAQLAAAAGVGSLQLSIAHEGGFALAVVVGLGSVLTAPVARAEGASGNGAGD